MIGFAWLPILFAGIANMVLGFIWYHPKVFGSVWMSLTGLSPESVEAGKKRMPVMAFGAFLAALVAAWVMNGLATMLGIFDWVGALFDLALWVWLGFVVPPMLGIVFWEGKSFKLFAINAGYWLVSLVLMALIVTYF